ncbi:MAG TPA: hypothetical protein VIE36_17685 [Methylomirabilota bacterium]|jgi:hypothetical protein
MDLNDHFVRFLVSERLDRAREDARRRALAPPPTRRSLRAWLGAALVAVGHRLQEPSVPQRATP